MGRGGDDVIPAQLQVHGTGNAGRFVDRTFRIRRFVDKLGRFVDRCIIAINRSDT